MRLMPRYLLAFVLLFVGYSVWDWYEHISRPGSEFAARPLDWAAFTASSCGTMIAIIVGGGLAIRRWRGRAGFPVYAGLLVAATMTHVLAVGPLMARVFFSGGGIMRFHPAGALVLSLGLVVILGILRLLLPPRPVGAASPA